MYHWIVIRHFRMFVVKAALSAFDSGEGASEYEATSILYSKILPIGIYCLTLLFSILVEFVLAVAFDFKEFCCSGCKKCISM